jgi:hypothetical protein
MARGYQPRVTAGMAADTHPSVPEGLIPSRAGNMIARTINWVLLLSPAIPAL